VFEDMVQGVIVPAELGYMGVLSDHMPSIVALRTGVVEFVDAKDQRHFVSIGGGFLETSGASAIILADTAERASEIDISRAERALEEARKALRGEVSGVTTTEATAELERAMNRIKAAKRG
jgi:F-type H+-transporting ATPase subunit epsilon